MSATEPPAAPPRPTVLIVDDEPTIRMLLAEVLDDLGYTTIAAVTAPSALAVIDAAGPVDLLITDIGLPAGMNGLQLAAAARAARPGLKVLFITGDAAAGLARQLEAGMHLIAKPFALDTVAALIRRIMAV